MIRSLFSFLTLLSLLAAARVAHAQGTSAAPSSATPPTIRESIVVTATGKELSESQVGASITVLDSRTIESATR